MTGIGSNIVATILSATIGIIMFREGMVKYNLKGETLPISVKKN